MYRIEEPIYFYFLAIIPVMIVVFLYGFMVEKKTPKVNFQI